MLNPFYWYSATWAVQIVLYMLGWSDGFLEINTGLFAVIVSTVVVSAFLGFLLRKNFTVSKMESNPHKTAWLTVAIVALFSMNFVYAGEAPLLNRILYGFNNYADFKGIPTFAPFIYTLTAFYCIYLIFIFAQFPSWRMAVEILACMFMFVMLSSRSYIATFLAAVIVAFTETRVKNKKKALLLFVLLGIAAVWLLGVLGNLRNGSWNDNSGIFGFGKINDKWPDWLPGQFAWGYNYITGSFHNLNYNVTKNLFRNDLVKYICCFLPDFVVNRLPVYFLSNGLLPNDGFTTSTVYTPAFNYGGYPGMTGMFIALVIAVLLTVLINRYSKRPALKNATMMVAVYFMALSFYHEPFFYPGSFMMLAFSVLFSLIFMIKDRKKKG